MNREQLAQPDKRKLSDLGYSRLRQTTAGEYIRSGGPDVQGAMRGAEDWLMEEALIRTAATYTPDSVLDELIARGWGDVPRERIPANWRERYGPGKRPPARKLRKPRTYLSDQHRSAIKAGKRLISRPASRVKSTLYPAKWGVGAIAQGQEVSGHTLNARRASK